MESFVETLLYWACNGLTAWVVYNLAHTGRWDAALGVTLFCLLCESDRNARKLDRIASL